MFSYSVAWGVFAITSVLMVAVAYEAFRTKSEAEQAMAKLREYSTGKRSQFSFFKLLVLFAVWFAAGVYVLDLQ